MNSPPIRFTKMHGLGNDFVLINAIDQSITLNPLAVAKLANRHTGIGFDQLLIISRSHQADFFCQIFNADGSEAEQCGNGLRCIARFLHEEEFIKKSAIKLETKAGIYPLIIHDYDQIEVSLGKAQIEDALMTLTLPTQMVEITIISIGNPHAIINMPDVDSASASQLAGEIAGEISIHPRFPFGANVGLMQIIDRHHIRLRTFERGVGETHACGSNACAAVIAGIKNGWLENDVKVLLRYGSLHIKWENDIIHLTGPASRVFAGELS